MNEGNKKEENVAIISLPFYHSRSLPEVTVHLIKRESKPLSDLLVLSRLTHSLFFLLRHIPSKCPPICLTIAVQEQKHPGMSSSPNEALGPMAYKS